MPLDLLTGQDMYAFYVTASEQNDIGVDDWQDLDEYDQKIWNDTAHLLRIGVR